MNIKIEKKSLPALKGGMRSADLNEFLYAITKVKEGESFFIPRKAPSNWNIAVRCADYWLGKKFSIRKDGTGYRVYCIEVIERKKAQTK